jgi:hypothetical protein
MLFQVIVCPMVSTQCSCENSTAVTQVGSGRDWGLWYQTEISFPLFPTGRINFDDFVQLCVVLQTLTASFRAKDINRDGVIRIRKFSLGMEIIVIMNINFSKFADYEEFLTMVLQTKM